jgi:DNA repair protein SbcD/Mre11
VSTCKLGRVIKIVHFSDLHLDSPFAWAGATGEVARRRRQTLRDSLIRIVDLTRAVGADALLCGGDLYEHERVTPDTAEFLRSTFASLGSTRVFIAPGNHDHFSPGSLYAHTNWPDNVHVFDTPALQPVALDHGLTLWGAAHRVPANTPNFLDGFSVDGDGVHIALFHGSNRTWWSEQDDGVKQPHAPFDEHQIVEAGLAHAFLGHYHSPKDAAHHTYPGNPEPLEFGERGERGAVVATIEAGGLITRERHRVAVTTAHDLTLDITGCTNQQQVRDKLVSITSDLSGLARLTVMGELDPSLELGANDLGDILDAVFDAHRIQFGGIHAAYDIETLRAEPTVKGRFVNDVLDSDLTPDEARRVLVTGLRALDGRSDLEVL